MRMIDADKLKPDLSVFLSLYAEEPIKVFSQELIDNAPAIEAEPVRHGSWKERRFFGGDFWDYSFVCDVCHGETPNRAFLIAPDYCPNCGAKMDGGNKNES